MNSMQLVTLIGGWEFDPEFNPISKNDPVERVKLPEIDKEEEEALDASRGTKMEPPWEMVKSLSTTKIE